MGTLGCLFAWLHPVGHLKRSAQRAVTPRPVRRALGVKNRVVHPIESAEREVFRTVDRAITSRRKKRRR